MTYTYLEQWNRLKNEINSIVEKHCYRDMRVDYSACPIDENDLPINNLHDVAVNGKVRFVQEYDPFYDHYLSGHDYKSQVFIDPTWLDVAIAANDMIHVTGNIHHIYLEDIVKVSEEDGVKIYRFAMGS